MWVCALVSLCENLEWGTLEREYDQMSYSLDEEMENALKRGICNGAKPVRVNKGNERNST